MLLQAAAGVAVVVSLTACSFRVSAEPAPVPAPEASSGDAVAPQTKGRPWRPQDALGCPEVEPDRRSLRFGTTLPLDCSRPNTCRSNRKLVGASVEEIYAYLGEPLHCEGERWTYRLNGDCHGEHDLLFLVVIDGRVEAVSHEHRFATQDCSRAANGG